MNMFVLACICIEIFYRLPVKSLFRFKCVSKEWLSLITDPFFIRHYQFLHPKSWTFIKQGVTNKRKLGFDITFAENHSSLKFSKIAFDFTKIVKPKMTSELAIIASSSGVLLMESIMLYAEAPPAEWEYIHYVVFNPVTKHYVLLPPLYEKDLSNRLHAEVGFLTQLDQSGVVSYTVVRIPKYICKSDTCHPFHVFSSQIGQWQESMVRLPRPSRLLLLRKPVVANQMLHIVNLSEYDGKHVVIVFDPYTNSEECNVFGLPSADVYNMWFGLLEGSLGCLWTDKLRNWKIWILKDYKEGVWSLAYHFVCVDLVSLRPKAFHPFDSKVIYFAEDDRSLFSYKRLRVLKLSNVYHLGLIIHL